LRIAVLAPIFAASQDRRHHMTMAWPRLCAANAARDQAGADTKSGGENGGTQMMHKVMLGTALCVALGLSLGAETASAKAADASAQRKVCRLAAAAPPLKLPLPTVLVDKAVSSPAEKMSRRVIYTPVPGGTNARDHAPLLVLLERQSRPAGLMLGVGF
jgi:hypothetical protein